MALLWWGWEWGRGGTLAGPFVAPALGFPGGGWGCGWCVRWQSCIRGWGELLVSQQGGGGGWVVVRVVLRVAVRAVVRAVVRAALWAEGV